MRTASFDPYVPKEVGMQRFVALAAFGVVALFLAPPMPAGVRAGGFSIGGIGGIGRIGGIGGIGRIGSIGGIGGIPPFSLRGWYTYPRSYGGWRRESYYPYGGGYSYPSGGNSYSAYYPPERSVNANAMTIEMHLPDSARVWVEGKLMSQTGPERVFESPTLTPGTDYSYDIRVQWNENGKSVERQRKVTVRAGDQIYLTFGK
jgi:uncharacterized protein (TIGR03000 family)